MVAGFFNKQRRYNSKISLFPRSRQISLAPKEVTQGFFLNTIKKAHALRSEEVVAKGKQKTVNLHLVYKSEQQM